MFRKTLLATVLLSMQIMVMASCSSEKLPELASASGTVVLNGNPISDVMVRFVPKAGTLGNGGFGKTDEKGHYTMRRSSGETGVQPGQYTVTFSKFVMPDGSLVPADVQPESVKARQVLPSRYTDINTSNTEVTVSETPGVFDFSLTTQ